MHLRKLSGEEQLLVGPSQVRPELVLSWGLGGAPKPVLHHPFGDVEHSGSPTSLSPSLLV